MYGYLNRIIPFAEPNTHNLTLDCKCRFIALHQEENGKVLFSMEPKCIKHLLKYCQYKIKKGKIPMNGLKLTYRWNVYNNGTTEVIK